MIKIYEGSQDMQPWVLMEIYPGRIFGNWWWEISYWDEKDQCWVHDYTKDGGAFTFWRAYRKATDKMQDCWFEQLRSSKEFIPCNECSAKPGCPTLCDNCLIRRDGKCEHDRVPGKCFICYEEQR